MITLKELNDKMAVGKASLQDHDPAVLYAVASLGNTYVEIGAQWGGSAIVAGLAGCEVHCIDHWEYPGRDNKPTPDAVRENWAAAGLNPANLFLYQHRHPPWPEELDGRKFDIGLIDGTHTEDACRKDWVSMRRYVTGYVLFHDVVAHAEPRRVFYDAIEDTKWELWTPSSPASQYGVVRRK